MAEKLFKVRCFEEETLLPFAASAVRLFVEFVEGSIYTHVFSPSEIRGRGKNPEESRSWNILPRSAWVRLSGTGIRFVWRRWTARRWRRSVEPLVQPYNSVNFIELPSPFLCPRNVLIFVPPSYFLLSGTFLSKWPDPTPEIRKKIGSAKNSRRFFV